MFTPWDLVRPRVWHPMASLEQSMMDFDRMSERMMASHAQLHLHDHDMHEDEFFSDLPVRRGSASTSGQAPQQQQQQQQQAASPEQQDADPRNAFSSYTFSNSTIVDDKGQRVSSTRRRYEDSSGRLKAIHERQIGDKKLRTAWNRQHKDDEGKHEQTLLGGAADEADASLDAFEAAWQQTAFGQAEEQNKKKQEAIKEKGESA